MIIPIFVNIKYLSDVKLNKTRNKNNEKYKSFMSLPFSFINLHNVNIAKKLTNRTFMLLSPYIVVRSTSTNFLYI